MERVRVNTARQDLAGRRDHGVVRAGQTSNRVEENDDVILILDQTLGFFDDHFSDLNVAGRLFVKGRADDFALHRALHVGHFFRTFVDKKDDQLNLGMVRGNRIRDVLQEDRLTSTRRSNDQAALTLAQRNHHVDNPRAVVGRLELKVDPLVRIQRRQVIEENLLGILLRRLEVDLFNLQKREITLAFLRGADRSADRIASAETEAANLRRGNVYVVRTGQVVVIRGTEEAEAIGQAFKHAISVDMLIFIGLLLKNGEDQILLAHSTGVLNAQFLGKLDQIADFLFFKFPKMHSHSPLLLFYYYLCAPAARMSS